VQYRGIHHAARGVAQRKCVLCMCLIPAYLPRKPFYFSPSWGSLSPRSLPRGQRRKRESTTTTRTTTTTTTTTTRTIAVDGGAGAVFLIPRTSPSLAHPLFPSGSSLLPPAASLSFDFYVRFASRVALIKIPLLFRTIHASRLPAMLHLRGGKSAENSSESIRENTQRSLGERLEHGERS